MVAPDVYVLPGVEPGVAITSWKAWEHDNVVPSFAFEMVSRNDASKDYREAPKAYDALGVRELIVFDAHHATSEERFQWQVFRRIKGRGLRRVEATNDACVRSQTLGCFLRVMGEGDARRVRLAIGARGETLVPTAEEQEREAEEESAKPKNKSAKPKNKSAKPKNKSARKKRRFQRRVAELESQLRRRR